MIYGLKEANRLEERVPTFAFNLKEFSPQQVAEELGKRDIYFWDENYYALSVTEMLGVHHSGMTLVGLVHYNKVEKDNRFGEALGEIATTKENIPSSLNLD